jgi:dTDP-4-dehydrorhamnose reductase
MKLLITGSNGQLGQDLQKACRIRRVDFCAGDVEEFDITDLELMREVVRREKPTAVVNCAAYNQVDQAETDFEAARRINALGPQNLAIAAEETGVPIMHFSTDFVFDGAKGAPYTVDDRPNPINRYGESKLQGEQAVASHSTRYFLVRLSWVFGIAGINFPKKVLEWAQNRSAIKVVTDQVSSPSYTTDLAGPILDLLRLGAFGTYHLTNRGHCSRFEWARFVIERSRPEVAVEPAGGDEFETAARRPAFSALDPAPLEDVLGRLLPDWQNATERFLKEMGVIR